MSVDDRARQRQAADAIRDVLTAEAEVRRKVEACREQLAQALAVEQERARAIEQRTSERLSRLHAHCEQRTEQRIAELRARADSQAVHIELNPGDHADLQVAVDQLSARLIGADDG
ncbi:MAG: hypothetical protein V2J42_00075 [Wenzhouxiangella sp.]|jgi:hypothetical protein|nr:hypothetical protein [Wenzhouxiangella sp.]